MALQSHLTSFPPGIAEAEIALKNYLGDDLGSIVAAAAAINDPVLTALATSPVARRKAAAESWKAARLTDALRFDPRMQKGFLLMDREVREKAKAGKLPFAEIEEGVRLALRDASLKTSEAKRVGMAALKGELRKLHVEPSSAKSTAVPSDLVVLADGSVSLFGNRRAAKVFGRASGQAWFHVPFTRDLARFHPVVDDALVDGTAPEAEPIKAAPEEQDPVKAELDDAGDLIPA
jgi:hypothetical protein